MKVIAVGSKVIVVLVVGMLASALLTLLLETLVLGLTHAIGPAGWIGAVLLLVLCLGLYRRSIQPPESDTEAIASHAPAR